MKLGLVSFKEIGACIICSNQFRTVLDYLKKKAKNYVVDFCGDNILILREIFCITSTIINFFCNLNWTASSVVRGNSPFRMASSSIIFVWKCWRAIAQSAITVRSAEASTVVPKGACASRDIKVFRSCLCTASGSAARSTRRAANKRPSTMSGPPKLT